MRLIEIIVGLGAIGVRLYSQMKLPLRLGRVEEYRLHDGWTKSAALVAYDQYIDQGGFWS